MVAVLVIPDGAAEPLGPGPTALERARTPVLDALAAAGEVARVAVTPPGLAPGSETGIPALLGHPPAAPVSRGWVDAAAYGVEVPAGWVPWRADVLDPDGNRATDAQARATARALSAHATAHAHATAQALGAHATARALSAHATARALSAHATTRALGPRAIWTRGHRLLLLAPAGERPTTDATGATGPLATTAPGAAGADPPPSSAAVLATASTDVLAPARTDRRAVYGSVRLWPDGPTLPRALDPRTVVIAGPGAAAGCARLLGADVIVPETATGDVDTDLPAKARAAIAAIHRGAQRVVVHVGAPDEAAHRRDPDAKAKALTLLDAHLMTPLRDAVQHAHGTLAVCPDHGTDPRTGAHDAGPVPGLLWGAHLAPSGANRLTERAVARATIHTPHWPLHATRQRQAVPA